MKKDFDNDIFDFLDEMDENKSVRKVKKKASEETAKKTVKRKTAKETKAIKETKAVKTEGKKKGVKKASSSPARRKKKKKEFFLVTFWKNLCESASEMSAGDRIVISTGVIVLVMAVITGSVYMSAKTVSAQVADFGELGQELDALEIAGESGLIAVADAHAAALGVDALEEEESYEEDEEEYNEEKDKDVEDEILLNLTSVEKDLKIKFMNKKGGKLIPGIAFEANVTDSGKKTATYKDDDKDGIIYKKDMTPGTYQVSIVPTDALNGYKYSTEPVKVTVKEKIEYKQIDVADEIKTEAQVNVAKEDTAVQEAETAPALKDTVEWVESTKTAVGTEDGDGGEFERIDKDDIPDPSASAKAIFRLFVKEGEEEDSGTQEKPKEEETKEPEKPKEEETKEPEKPKEEETKEPEKPKEEETKEPEKPGVENKINSIEIRNVKDIEAGGTVQLEAKVSASGEYEGSSVTWDSSNKDIAVVDEKSGIVTGKSAGTVTITATSVKDKSKKATCTITVKNPAGPSIKLEPAEVSVKKGEAVTLTVKDTSITPAWKSSDESVATVDKNGSVTGVKAGTATITATVKDGYNQEASASCKVTVTETTALSVSLDSKELTVYIDDKKELKATVSNANGNVTYTYGSDKTDIAKIDSSDKEKGIIKGIKEGKAVVTVTAKDDSGATATASCEVKVKLNPQNDKTTKLKDKDGNQIYIKNSKDEYVEAVVADYYTARKFYKKAANVKYKYTGWQTIDGKIYYFDKKGNPVTGEQIIQGAKYVFGSDGAIVTNSSNGIMGIDVSKWNGTINWTAVKSSGVNYAIIRCGYRGSSTGALIQDPKFKSNIQGAQAAGIKVGVYFFTQAVNEVEAVEEASMVLNLISGNKLSYPVFIDVESSGGRADGLDKGTRTSAVNAFCRTIQNGGYTAGIYANKTWFEGKMNTSSLSGYKIWLAQYAAAPTYKATRYDMWQYTSKGKIGGINGNVDLNISYLGY